jgi:hypothetical protein
MMDFMKAEVFMEGFSINRFNIKEYKPVGDRDHEVLGMGSL